MLEAPSAQQQLQRPAPQVMPPNQCSPEHRWAEHEVMHATAKMSGEVLQAACAAEVEVELPLGEGEEQ